MLKARPVSAGYFEKARRSLRFFGPLSNAGTGVARSESNPPLGAPHLVRLGLGDRWPVPRHRRQGSVVRFRVPFPWWGVQPRGLDIRYPQLDFPSDTKLLYTPLAGDQAIGQVDRGACVRCSRQGGGRRSDRVLANLPRSIRSRQSTGGSCVACAEFVVARGCARDTWGGGRLRADCAQVEEPSPAPQIPGRFHDRGAWADRSRNHSACAWNGLRSRQATREGAVDKRVSGDPWCARDSSCSGFAGPSRIRSAHAQPCRTIRC